MKRTLVFYLTTVLLFSTAHRAPAPIQEVPESPTPEHSAKPRPRPKPTPEATLKPKSTPLSWAGTWQTRLRYLSSAIDEMQLSQTGNHVSGTYNYKGGVVDGTSNGNILSGTWTQTSGDGVFHLSLSSDGKSFSGNWSASNGSSGTWTGTRK
jgi:hypothetical protein